MKRPSSKRQAAILAILFVPGALALALAVAVAGCDRRGDEASGPAATDRVQAARDVVP